MKTQSINLDAAGLLEQERRLRFAEFGHNAGVELGLALLKAGRSADLPIAIDVFAFGQQLFHAGLPGSCADNGSWIARKRNSVLRFAHSSLYMGQYCREQGVTLEEKYYVSSQEYASHGGSFPIILTSGSVVGAATVSGLAQHDDHDLVVDVMSTLL